MLADVVARAGGAPARAAPTASAHSPHLLQLGELLQEARAHVALGPHGQVDWLRAAIATPTATTKRSGRDLESDASRVQILTLHKSKGLEFPLVFLPFAGIGRAQRRQARDVVRLPRCGRPARAPVEDALARTPARRRGTRPCDAREGARTRPRTCACSTSA